MNLGASIKHCLANLARFSGRDAPKQFWPYTIALVGLAVSVWMIAGIGAMSDTLGRMQRFAEEHPDQATVTRGPGHYSIQIERHHPELMPDIAPLFGLMAIIMLVFAIMTAAAVTRRLHDSDTRGWIGLVPLGFAASGFALMSLVFRGFGSAEAPDMTWFFVIFVNNLLYLASLAWLVYRLVRRGTSGDNRFGPPPTI